MLVKINLGWHTDYIMAMSMSGAVRTCVTQASAAPKSDVSSGRQAVGIARSLVPEELSLCTSHSLTGLTLPLWGVSAFLLPWVALEVRT